MLLSGKTSWMVRSVCGKKVYGVPESCSRRLSGKAVRKVLWRALLLKEPANVLQNQA